MVDISLNKILILIMYLVIIILIVLFLDYLFKITVRKNRKNKIMELAKIKSSETNKSIIVFNDKNNGIVINTDGTKEAFNGDIIEISDQMSDNSCILVLSEILEYLDDVNEKSYDDIINQLKLISGGDLYCANIEKNSPRVLWDYNIKNIMDKSYYLPGSDIIRTKPNGLQIGTQNFYRQIFKVLPYDFFAKDPITKI